MLKKLFLTAAFLCFLIAASAAFAACTSPNTFTVTQNAAINWSAWAIPSTSVTGIINTAGATSGTGSQIFGTKAAGSYTVKKSSTNNSCASITFSILSPSCAATGCTLSGFTGSWNGGTATAFPITSTTLPASGGGTTLLIGGTATFDNTVTAGAYVPTYTIGIHYNTLTDATYAETGAIIFDTPLSIGNVTNINFGTVKAATAATYTINTAGTITTTGGAMYGGATHAGSMTIYGPANDTITITTGSYVASGIGSAVTPSAATCSYNGGAAVACTNLTAQMAPTPAGKTLLLGVMLTITGTAQTAGSSATPSFTVTVTYT